METFGDAVRRLRGQMSLRELARRTYIDPGHLSRIEAGQRPPTAKLAEALDTALDAGDELVTLAAALPSARRQRAQPDGGRRAALAATVVHPEVHDLATMRSLRTADSRLGGSYLYASVTSYLRSAVAPRLFDFASDLDYAHVFSAAAALTEMAGWMAHDAGDDQLAEQHFRGALGMATAARDRQLGAHVLGSLSHLALHGRKPEQGLAHAHQGQQLGGASATPEVRARLFAMQARGHAAIHREAECLASLFQAEKALSAASDEAPSPWVSAFDQASLAAEAARCLRQLRHFEAARRQAEQVVTLRPTDRARSRAFAHLMLASNLVDEGRPYEACAVASEVLGTTRNVGSYLVVQQLERLDQSLTPYQSSADVRVFREQLRDELRGRSWLFSWLPANGLQTGPQATT